MAENFRKVSQIPPPRHSAPSNNVEHELRRNNPIHSSSFRPSFRDLWSLTYAPFDIHFSLGLINERISICTPFVSPFVKYLKPVFALSFGMSLVFLLLEQPGSGYFSPTERERGRGRRKSTYCFSRVHCVRNCVLRWLHIRWALIFNECPKFARCWPSSDIV